MKYITVILCLFISSCSSVVSLNENKKYAYIVTNHLIHTQQCNGESLIIVGVRQENHVAIDLLMNSIYIPEGKNYIYYNKVTEYPQNGKCENTREILVRHSEVTVPPLQRRPMGEELEVNVEGGKTYFLLIEKGNVILEKIEQ